MVVSSENRWVIHGHFQEVLERERESSVPLLVVELKFPAPIVLVGEDPVVFCYPHSPAQNISRGRTWIHAEAAGVDDVDAAVGRDIRASPEAFDPIDALCDV